LKSHSFFTSPRERIIWIFSILILIGIFLSLIIGRPLLELFKNQDLQAGIFLLGIIFIGAYIILYGLISKPNIIELLLVIGIISVYLLLFLRLGLPERSHLIEYSALCLTIHEALLERKKQGKQITHIGFWAFAITILIGLIDEIIQIFIPNRVFDVNDILFNCFTAFMAIGVSMSIQYFRQK
jgi:hypothetical protein